MKIKPPSKRKYKLQPLVRRGKKVGRNDKCPCDNGKKYKYCCLPKEIKRDRPPQITIETVKKSYKRTKHK